MGKMVPRNESLNWGGVRTFKNPQEFQRYIGTSIAVWAKFWELEVFFVLQAASDIGKKAEDTKKDTKMNDSKIFLPTFLLGRRI